MLSLGSRGWGQGELSAETTLSSGAAVWEAQDTCSEQSREDVCVVGETTCASLLLSPFIFLPQGILPPMN